MTYKQAFAKTAPESLALLSHTLGPPEELAQAGTEEAVGVGWGRPADALGSWAHPDR